MRRSTSGPRQHRLGLLSRGLGFRAPLKEDIQICVHTYIGMGTDVDVDMDKDSDIAVSINCGSLEEGLGLTQGRLRAGPSSFRSVEGICKACKGVV